MIYKSVVPFFILTFSLPMNTYKVSIDENIGLFIDYHKETHEKFDHVKINRIADSLKSWNRFLGDLNFVDSVFYNSSGQGYFEGNGFAKFLAVFKSDMGPGLQLYTISEADKNDTAFVTSIVNSANSSVLKTFRVSYSEKNQVCSQLILNQDTIVYKMISDRKGKVKGGGQCGKYSCLYELRKSYLVSDKHLRLISKKEIFGEGVFSYKKVQFYKVTSEIEYLKP